MKKQKVPGVTLQIHTLNGNIANCQAVKVFYLISLWIYFSLVFTNRSVSPQSWSFFFAECKTTAMERNYFGSVSTTTSGFLCQRWDSQSPHPHNLTNPERFPDVSVEAASNYCRNPDGKAEGPWCFTDDPFMEWEYCDIPVCSGL